MKKTLLSIMAAAGLIASGAALADTSLVEVYGTLNADFENVKATGGATSGAALPAGQVGTINTSATTGRDQPSRNKVESNSTNIGFRGKEDLGMGWNAWFQVESQANLDSGAQFWASRNSGIGLSSQKYGTIFYGQWDTPYKVANVSADAFYGTGSANNDAITGTPGFAVVTATAAGRGAAGGGAAVAADASFDRRQGNSVQYWSPNIYGFIAKFAYSANEQRSAEPASASGTTTNPNISPTIYSIGLRYDRGPLILMYNFEQHRDYFGLSALGGSLAAGIAAVPTSVTNNTSRDNGNRATIGYKFDFWGKTTAYASWERLDYNNSDTVAGHLIKYRRDAIDVSVLQQFGPNTFRLGYTTAHSASCTFAGGAGCSGVNTGASRYAFGYSYSMSKRTDLYAFYARVNNDQFANYQLGLAHNALSTPPPAGSHLQSIGLGIRHVF